ncbi:far upstream element-binding protein 2-like isoform X1 [Senna tora]|uniref:Far upstream element-binding protein 2-like isoform X1 n=1 Tax=Senna tora TaxID=362788 RepID=A0A834TNZ1_9FABA|nr:far upstream element-binding protein 2-like isoform X1 [Senna tora]
MAEEQVLAAETSPVPSDLKRKFEDLEPEAPQQPTDEKHLESNVNSNSEPDDEGEKKRPRIDEELDGEAASKNGYQDEQVGEPVKEKEERSSSENALSQDGQPTSNELPEASTEEQTPDEIPEQAVAKESVEDSRPENAEEPSKESQEHFVESTEQDASSGGKKPESAETEIHTAEVLDNKQDPSSGQEQPTPVAEITTRKIEVPNNKVGVLIGKAGDTIRYLQYNSGAKIQITRDADADPHSTSRPVELIGSLDSIEKAEKLISAVIAEADAGGSPALVARGLSSAQAAAGAEQIQIQVPNEKVGLIIGRGGETIKGLQTKSGARIQVLIPQHLAEGDDSKERTVQVTGDKRQVEIAREMIKEVMSQPVRPSTGGFGQQGFRPPRGSGGPPQWGQRGSHYAHPTPYDNQQRGQYHSHNPPYASAPYGNYPQHMAPRSNFGSGWEQRPHASMQGPPPHSGNYEYYGGQGGHLHDAPPSNPHPSSVPPHGAGPSPVPSMGPPPSQVNYNYGQPQGPDYGHQAPYSQAGYPQQSYGHGYDETKFDNRAPTQYPYGGHASSQPTYPQAGTQPNFAAQQQYGKPPLYGMPSQGQPPQSYGPPRATQPGEMPYQGSTPAQLYGTNVPQQQPYPYASSGSQAAYPTYGSAPVADSYNHPPPASGPVYAQAGGQPGYAQPGTQQAPSYGQVAPTGAYGSYPSSQQAYTDQQSAPNNAGYAYPQDPGYSSGPAPAYTAAPNAQPAYVQPTPTQTGYDQSNPQAAAASYGAVQATAPAAYGKTVSPQPTYPQYDSTQAYAAPR